MLTSTATGATALTVSADFPAAASPEPADITTASGISPLPPQGQAPKPEHIRHLLFGTPTTVQTTIRLLHHLGYAEPNDWSRPISTGRANEVMAILTKRISLG